MLVAALVVGGTTWYVMDKSAKEIQQANEDSIAALQKQIDDQEVTTTTTTTKTTDPTTGWKTFTQNLFKFTLKYPDKYSVNSVVQPTSKSFDQLVSMDGSINISCTWVDDSVDYRSGATATTFGSNVFYKSTRDGKPTYSLLFKRSGNPVNTANLLVITDNNNAVDIANILSSFKAN